MYAPRPGQGGVSDALDRREIHGDAGRVGEIWKRGRRHDRGAGDVGVEGPPPRVGIGVGEASQRTDRGRVHERVDAAERGRRFDDGRPARRLVGHVAGDRDGPVPGLLRGRIEPFAATSEHCHARTPLREADPDAPPEAARGADDDSSHGVFSFEGRRPRLARQTDTDVRDSGMSLSYGGRHPRSMSLLMTLLLAP